LIGGEIIDEQKIINRAGYIERCGDREVFHIFPEVFRKKICEGLDYKTVEDVLINEGFMRVDADGRRLPKKQIQGTRVRMYSIFSDILGDQ
jgi:putative DNA primase/helicase